MLQRLPSVFFLEVFTIAFIHPTQIALSQQCTPQSVYRSHILYIYIIQYLLGNCLPLLHVDKKIFEMLLTSEQVLRSVTVPWKPLTPEAFT